MTELVLLIPNSSLLVKKLLSQVEPVVKQLLQLRWLAPGFPFLLWL
ncbi:MAG: hypothetical protein P8169_06685 [Chloroflexota bacterium]